MFFDTLAEIPTTLLWGGMSDILKEEDIVEKMNARKAELKVVEVSNRGHVPLFYEPECITAIDELLVRLP